MIGQINQKTGIYHRDGCRYAKRINHNSVKLFDFHCEDLRKYKSCKCCCNLKKIYEDYKPDLKMIFADFDITTEFDGQYVRVHTPRYNWRIFLKESSQNMKLYREQWNEECGKVWLVKCSELEKTPEISTVMRFIAHEERVAKYPASFRNDALEIEQYAEEKGLEIKYVGEELYILTDMAAWKIACCRRTDGFKLLHCPFGEEPLTMEEAKKGQYHIQADVPRNYTPFERIKYVYKHDTAKKIEQVSYKYLPRNTKRQRKYYRQAKDRATRKSIGRVFKIFEELEARGEFANEGQLMICPMEILK